MKSRMMICLAALFTAVMTAVPAAYAGTATANLNVSATVTANCVLSASPLAFGSYDGVSANATRDLDGVGFVSVTCTNGSAATITLGQGANPYTGDGSTDAAPQRRMNSGSYFLSYALYQDAARTTVWGNTAETGVSSTGTGSSNEISVFGRMVANQSVPAGSYLDTVVATVTF